ncbi:PIN domain-containing protein [uncultured Thiodictyon sp.]|uniref:PIN domain-containing protein n=1 Tax=uncultured Thiodictyon sp. TaxID=1846217 RepID=UPI0025CF4411|nr:PIN domain-containing protein [uncultured Thiodictyon sp.]
MSLTVRARVVDLRTDAPKNSDVFLVDTNAWYWLFYPRASQTPGGGPEPYQLGHYPAFLKSAISAGATLHCYGLAFAELAHNIEKAEREIYADQAGREIGPKAFRHDYPSQRRKLVSLISDTWADVQSVSTLLPLSMDNDFMRSALALFPAVGLDGYDLFMADAALRAGISQIVTDDGDFASVHGITVFTANQRVIRDAQASGKLLIR